MIKLSDEIKLRRIIEFCKNKKISIIANSVNDLHLKCDVCNYEWKSSYKLIIKKRSCKRCNKHMIPSQVDVDKKITEICEFNNYDLLETFVYKNHNSRLKLKCNTDGNMWQPTYYNLVYKKHKCKKCIVNIPTQDGAEKIIANICIKFNYQLLNSFTYTTSKNTKISVICLDYDNYIWNTTYYSLVYQESKCPKCKMSKLEMKLEQILINNNISYIYQYSCDFLDKLSLDFYLPDFNIAIECQGIQHFEPVEHFGGIKKYNKVVERDNRKYNLCLGELKLLYFTDVKNIINYNFKIYIDEQILTEIK